MNIWPQEPYSEGEAALEIAVERSRARHPRRDREAPGPQSTPSGRLRRQARHHLGLISKARRQGVRWLQTSAVSGPPWVAKEVEALVVRMVRENTGWGYDRVVGALTNLGHRLSDQTVGNILRRHGIAPAPKRSQTTSWKGLSLPIRISWPALTSSPWKY